MAIKPLSSSPGQSTPHDHGPAARMRFVWSGSSTRSHAHIAPVIVRVSIASGIRMRVNRKRPMQVASATPAYIPAEVRKCPASKTISEPAQQNYAERERKTRGPVMHAKNPIRTAMPSTSAGIFRDTRRRPGGR